eukprot:Nitzschia sp. Nitz4//scaffold110_size71422//46618//49986//NITZ4_005878-RA/size71422-augustus-gene-0.13-mRNA-1//1//CDS//3329533101//2536//frame0
MGSKSKKAKRSLTSVPKGLVHRKGSSSAERGNPFEAVGRMKRPKHEVHNRPVSKPKQTKHALESLQRRQSHLRTSLKSSKKTNVLVDRRIGQYDPSMSQSDQMLARLVKERTRQSQRSSKFRLDDDDNHVLTHKGRKLDPTKNSEPIISDDEEDYGNLEAIDTQLHFGGSGMTDTSNPYGASAAADLSQMYGQRKTELDDLIARRKAIKAEKMQAKEAQLETVEQMDDNFAELAQLLTFRANQPVPTKPPTAKEKAEDDEMKQWDTEMKEMMFKPKGKATDRTKTPEEIAKEEAERLHKLETRRLARMNGDFEEDDLSDISVKGYASKRTKNQNRNPDELSDSEDEQDDEPEARFTADGLKYFNKDGTLVEDKEEEAEDDDESDDSDDESEGDLPQHPLPKGTRVKGNYRIAEQFEGQEAWYDGEISKVHVAADGKITYDVEYLDGDFEEDMLPENVRPVAKTTEEKEKEEQQTSEAELLRLKRSKARDQARTEMPYVFDAPTTLEALHDLIAKYAETGKDATAIIQRIHRANSVRLDHRNTEKMQNFYDVLLRRFMAVGDALGANGDGGKELGRYEQLSAITKVLYAMAQDSSESAAAIWSRRVGILQNAHAKRLRDYEVRAMDDEEASPWPSVGVFLLLKASTLIFPVTDRRHHIMTPVDLLLGQIVAQTPITNVHDLIMGILCTTLLIENGVEAKRVAPEALAYLSGVIRLFASSATSFAIPTLEGAYNLAEFEELRGSLQSQSDDESKIPTLQLEVSFADPNNKSVGPAILGACLNVIESFATKMKQFEGVLYHHEMLAEVSASLLALRPKDLPPCLRQKTGSVAALLANLVGETRAPLQRGQVEDHTGIKTLAPRLEDPERYSMSRDKGKKSVQAAIDRTRREFKREHKAVSRELRMDANFIEQERRAEKNKSDSKARAKRQKNFAWLEGEQAAMNQQVAQGGGLLKGGGMGAAKSKAASGKLGIKKGGKF